jgi:hypothetical protein
VNLQAVERFVVSGSVVRATVESLREAGEDGFERFVLWSGVVTDKSMSIRTAHVPEQTAYRTESGLMVRVDGDALHRLNTWLYKENETLAAQVHAHPTGAFHSGTDDAYPIVTALGGLSIVLPDFATRGFFTRDVKAYRLTPDGWRRIAARRFRGLVEVD